MWLRSSSSNSVWTSSLRWLWGITFPGAVVVLEEVGLLPIDADRDVDCVAAQLPGTALLLGPALNVVRRYQDFISGREAQKRPGFQRILADARAGLFDVILVYHSSRF